ncbi:MAG: sel1 repeat family protein [Alphaproteobacteria bacterium]|nr:sel1 repeat family protein [Alphaproteobacteria bacterium]
MRVLLLVLALLAVAPAAAQEPGRLDRDKTRTEAEGGDLEAAFMLGRMYRDGVGGPEDKGEARKWLRKAAQGGHVRASVLLGLMLIRGEGGTVDREAARPLLLFGAAARDDLAPYALGVLFAEGQSKGGGGPEQDAAAAVFWFRTAALRGNVDGMYNLGLMHLRGLGVPRDPAEAYGWFLKAAEAGEGQAQIILATMLSEGQGVPADPKMALVWYYRAKANGLVDDTLEVALVKRLTPDEVAEAKRLAGEPPAARVEPPRAR